MNIFLFAKKVSTGFLFFCPLKRKHFPTFINIISLYIFWQLSSNPKCDINVSWFGTCSSNRFSFYSFFLYTLSYSSFLLFQHKNLFKIIFSFFILNFSTLLDYRYHRRISLELHKNTLKLPDFELEKKREFLKKSF